MNNKPATTKSTVWILIVIAVVGFGYYYFSSNSTPADSNSLSSTDSTTAAAGVRVLNLLNQVQSLQIDKDLFKDAGFKTLVDYSVTIPPVNVGRPNPFAPVPGLSTTQTGTRGTR